MERYGIDVFVVADSDPHSSEYPAGRWKARSWLSGFTGSNGTLVVARGEAALWTDGRYYIQAENQLAGSGIAMMKGAEPGTPSYPAWIAERAKDGFVVGVDGKTTSCTVYNDLKKALGSSSGVIKITIDIDHDVIGEIWTDGRPGLPGAPVFCHDFRYSGRHSSDKITAVRAELKKRGADSAVICGLDDVAWLFNIRGGDVPKLPVAYAYAFISMDAAELYIEKTKAPVEVAVALAGQGVKVVGAGDLAGRLEALEAGGKICCDAGKLSIWLRNRIPELTRVIFSDEPTVSLKAVKNDVELQGHRESQAHDGAAMARFLMWLEKEMDSGAVVRETDAARALSGFRAQSDLCRGDSFNTIAGYGPNGAMMHYAPGEDGGAVIKNTGLMVVDSGGQYPGGTTDITRTIVFKETTPQERSDFTLTLKSHIALASARFLYGAAGGHIDSIARKVMWDHGLDYKCGTGHGIGVYLSVHEGPQSISMRTTGGARLEENMIVSIEPGVYREGKHGVRTENLARITEDYTNEFGRFMRFETLSFCPISIEGLEIGMLDAAERKWLNNYHRETYEKISPLLDEGERAWLANATREI